MKSRRIAVLLMLLVALALGQSAYAESMPPNFPFAACPGGTIIESYSGDTSQIVEFKTTQSAAQISAFYTQDIKAKGWNLTSGGMQTPDYSVLRATKGKAKVVMHLSGNRARLVLLFNPE
jgi:hypothetical protein